MCRRAGLADSAERRRVEVAGQALADAFFWVADDIGPLRARTAAEVGYVAGLGDIERQPALERADAGELPASQDMAQRIPAVLEDRELPDVVETHHVGSVQ